MKAPCGTSNVQLRGLRAISVVSGNTFYGGKEENFQTHSAPADLTPLSRFMTGIISTYKCGLAEEKLWGLLLVLLISADLQRNLAHGSCCNERAFVSAVGFCVHTFTVHKHRKEGHWERRVGMKAKHTGVQHAPKCSHANISKRGFGAVGWGVDGGVTAPNP